MTKKNKLDADIRRYPRTKDAEGITLWLKTKKRQKTFNHRSPDKKRSPDWKAPRTSEDKRGQDTD